MTTDENLNDEGGESACFVHLVCPECGVVVGDSDHQPLCTYVDPKSTLDRPDREEPSRGDDLP